MNKIDLLASVLFIAIFFTLVASVAAFPVFVLLFMTISIFGLSITTGTLLLTSFACGILLSLKILQLKKPGDDQ